MSNTQFENFPGVNAVYEQPVSPAFEFDNSKYNNKSIAERIARKVAINFKR